MHYPRYVNMNVIYSEYDHRGGRVVKSLPLNRVRSLVGSVFLVEVFPEFFFNRKTNVGKTSLNHSWISLAIIIIKYHSLWAPITPDVDAT